MGQDRKFFMSQSIQGIIFDMDNTLVQAPLDFAVIKADLGFPKDCYILEERGKIKDPQRIKEIDQILKKHEIQAAQNSKVIPGVIEFLKFCDDEGIKRALHTRNCKEATKHILETFDFQFEWFFTREDGPAKPDPTIPVQVSKTWNIPNEHCLFVGDFIIDIETGRAANMQTALIQTNPKYKEFQDSADFSFKEYHELKEWIVEKSRLASFH